MSLLARMQGKPPRMKNQQSVRVGLPFENTPVLVHPVDNTAEDERIYLVYDKFDCAQYCIDPNYVNQANLFAKKIKFLTLNVLYRAIDMNGIEFIIPVADYDLDYRDLILKMIKDSRNGNWIVRTQLNSNKKFDYYILNDTDLLPKWSNMTFDDLFDKAFSHHLIKDDNHIAVQSFEYKKDKKNM